MKRFLTITLTIVLFSSVCFAQLPGITEKTNGMKLYSGYFNFYWDEQNGKIWLEIDKPETEFLYIISLTGGLGSNDIGLDRNKLGSTKIVKFERIGPKVLLTQPNYRYRALSDNPDERQAVTDAFAQSVIWGFKVEAEENGKILVDATPFLLRDADNSAGTIKRSNQGNFKFDNSRSAFYLPKTKNFPKNTEIETIITLTGDNPGGYVRQVAPDPTTITLRQHHSFVELPDDNYKPREYDPRSSFGSTTYLDYATPISEPIVKRYINRHRINKVNPNAEISEAVEPIVYYVDRGTPEPIRSALILGASWWNQAFEAAGYRNGFRVELLPEGADPMDLRYNVINWVHRSTRGWSYGSSVVDPRTGEIIKGHVSLGSLRVRQDYMIAEGLLAPYEEGKPVTDEMQKMALARIRQLSVHEVGHTLGLMHNYVSSAHGRASVMDYPHPLVKLDGDGNIDLSDAYDTGVGEWDKISVEYGYRDFPDNANEREELDAIIKRAYERGYYTIADQDARPPGSAHPLTHLWDNGKHPVDELKRVMEIRRTALNNFSENNIRMRAPLATLEDVLVPIYMFHRYQIEASAKVIGGVYFYYNLRGDGQKLPEIVSPDEQRRALDEILVALSPKELALDERIINLIPPRPPGYGQTPELFNGRTGSTFDPIGAAETLANLTTGFILNGERAARLVEYNSRNNRYPGLGEVIDKLVDKTWKTFSAEGYHAEISRAVNMVVLNNIMNLAVNKNTASQARAIAMMKIEDLKIWMKSRLDVIRDENQRAHIFFAVTEIEQFQKDPSKFVTTTPLAPPAGPPIGSR